jgi:hypothetical protein
MAKGNRSNSRKRGKKEKKKLVVLNLLQREILKEIIKEGAKWIWDNKDKIAEELSRLL